MGGERSPVANGPRRLCIAGGGSGGHIFPGVAIADEWKRRLGSAAEIVFVGARGALEERLVPRAGHRIELLSIGALNRVSLATRIATLARLPWAILRSALLLLRFRPSAVLGVGGYASGPLVLAATLLRPLLGIRVAILQLDSKPGLTNRLLGRRVDLVLAAFPGTEAHFPPGRTKVTGDPIREAFVPLPPAPRDPFVVFVFGGSQGAMGINSLVIEAISELAGQVEWIHQTGEIDHDRVSAAHREAGTRARVERFIHDMPAAYRQASLVVGRAGASTLAELAAVGRASVLIPLPTAADDHQTENARVYERAGAAVVCPQRGSTGKDLARVIRELRSHPARLTEMESRAATFARPRAAAEAVDQLLALGSG